MGRVCHTTHPTKNSRSHLGVPTAPGTPLHAFQTTLGFLTFVSALEAKAGRLREKADSSARWPGALLRGSGHSVPVSRWKRKHVPISHKATVELRKQLIIVPLLQARFSNQWNTFNNLQNRTQIFYTIFKSTIKCFQLISLGHFLVVLTPWIVSVFFTPQ